MATRQPGLETDSFAMWSHALGRGLLRDEVMRSMREREGYTDVMPMGRHPGETAASLGPARVGRRRSIFCRAAESRNGTIAARRQQISPALSRDGDERVLEVGCGSGRFTGWIASRLRGVGFVIAVDPCESLLRRAVRENAADRAVYMFADVRTLPFDDGAFDVVCCLTGLHLIDEPTETLHQMVRMVAPCGRIAVAASYGPQSLLGKPLELAATICGLRTFDRTTIPAFFAAAGLTDVEQQLHGASQFVTARRPGQIAELRHWRGGPAARSRRHRPTT